MSRSVLYFPYISVPQSAWFTRVLLYWDQVGSIVPGPHAEDLSRVSPFMRDLIETDLIRPIVPEEFDSRLQSASGPFLTFVDSDPEIGARAEQGFASKLATRGGAETGTAMHIHRGKFGGTIGDSLVEKGLARPSPDSPEWLEVESRTASAYMAFLATTLGSLDDVGMDPITDTLTSLTPFVSAEVGANPLSVAAELRMGVLEAVLPGPAEDVSISSLVDFKERHGERLTRFRRRIESELLDLATTGDPEVRAFKQGVLTEDLQEELAEVRARMRVQWTKLLFGTLCAIGAATPAGPLVTSGNVPAAAFSLLGLMKAVLSVHESAQGPLEARRHPLAYAALAQERLSA